MRVRRHGQEEGRGKDRARVENGADKDGESGSGPGAGTRFGVETGSPNKNPRKIVFIKMIKARLCMLCDKHGVSD
jgi:hypothetical protein